MTRTAFWLFLLLASITDSQHILTMPSQIVGYETDSEDDGGEYSTEGGQELDLIGLRKPNKFINLSKAIIITSV